MTTITLKIPLIESISELTMIRRFGFLEINRRGIKILPSLKIYINYKTLTIYKLLFVTDIFKILIIIIKKSRLLKLSLK